ncbi:hypothetical protein BC828DRAFT_135025 [Blastocladiella britannica]|nr:hypothetical protein BC828DRAFT_135025 [Blastocladiella britannica]
MASVPPTNEKCPLKLTAGTPPPAVPMVMSTLLSGATAADWCPKSQSTPAIQDQSCQPFRSLATSLTAMAGGVNLQLDGCIVGYAPGMPGWWMCASTYSPLTQASLLTANARNEYSIGNASLSQYMNQGDGCSGICAASGIQGSSLPTSWTPLPAIGQNGTVYLYGCLVDGTKRMCSWVEGVGPVNSAIPNYQRSCGSSGAVDGSVLSVASALLAPSAGSPKVGSGTPSGSTATAADASSSSKMPIILGSVLGGAVLFAAAIAVFAMHRRRNARRDVRHEKDVMTSAAPTSYSPPSPSLASSPIPRSLQPSSASTAGSPLIRHPSLSASMPPALHPLTTLESQPLMLTDRPMTMGHQNTAHHQLHHHTGSDPSISAISRLPGSVLVSRRVSLVPGINSVARRPSSSTYARNGRGSPAPLMRQLSFNPVQLGLLSVVLPVDLARPDSAAAGSSSGAGAQSASSQSAQGNLLSADSMQAAVDAYLSVYGAIQDHVRATVTSAPAAASTRASATLARANSISGVEKVRTARALATAALTRAVLAQVMGSVPSPQQLAAPSADRPPPELVAAFRAALGAMARGGPVGSALAVVPPGLSSVLPDGVAATDAQAWLVEHTIGAEQSARMGSSSAAASAPPRIADTLFPAWVAANGEVLLAARVVTDASPTSTSSY